MRFTFLHESLTIFKKVLLFHFKMQISSAKLTSKSQITVPSWVRKSLKIQPKMEVVWIELRPGEISVVAKDSDGGNPVEKLCGILKGKGADDIDLVQSLLDDRKKDIELEERGFLNN